MSFTGKATYTAGDQLPEIAEDVTDLVAINSPHETPLLDALGDGPRSARSTVHEWIEDQLLPNTDVIGAIVSSTVLAVNDFTRFRVGDLIRFDGASEIAMVTAVDALNSRITLVRAYGGTTQATLAVNQAIFVIGNASLEGADADAARFLSRSRLSNYTQIFASTISVSGSEVAVNQIGVRDEIAWQKNLRTKELLRDLENSVINGVAATDTPGGSATVRRTMRGIVSTIASNAFHVGQSGFPADTALTEAQLNLAMRNIWKNSSGNVDLIVVGGREKRSINQFVASNRRYYNANDTFKDSVSVYESDFGVCQVVLSRYVPTGTVLLLDSSRIAVLPLSGRSFQYTALARTGDAETGQVIGEYTLEMRNESAHGVISGFTS